MQSPLRALGSPVLLQLSPPALLFCGLNVALLVSALLRDARKVNVTDFTLTAYISVIIMASVLHPLFDPDMAGFRVLVGTVVLLGGLISGVIAMLAPNIVSGCTLGVYVAILISSVYHAVKTDNSSTEQLPPMSSIPFLLCIGCCIMFSQFRGATCRCLKWSLGVSLFLVLSIDALDNFDMTVSLVHLFQRMVTPFPNVDTSLSSDHDSGADNLVLNNLCTNNKFSYSCRPHLLIYHLMWIIVAFILCVCRGNCSGDFQSMMSCFGKIFSGGTMSNRARSQQGYVRVNTVDQGDSLDSNRHALLTHPNEKKSPGKSAPQRTFSYPDSLEFNYFDPDNLPIAVQAYADCIFTSVQSLSAEIGFQVDNSRNQAEHLLMMLTNETQKGDHLNPTQPPLRLHRKLFGNYSKWCESLGIDEHFTPVEHTYGKSYAAKIEDMLVFLLVWGEAANLKHMPECVCYLYHKTMEDHLSLAMKKHFASNNVVFYPGYFLDMVVTPIYDVVSKSLKSGGDHCDRKTYDDFNEFFWSSNCLQFAHHHAYVGMASSEAGTVSADDDRTTVSDAMQQATKTYIEKRSWMHPLNSFHRLFEWHIVTFTILGTIAFHSALVWPVAYTLMIGSFIFLEINMLGLCWICLDIWTIFPTTSLSGPNTCGYILRLLVGYTILLLSRSFLVRITSSE